MEVDTCTGTEGEQGQLGQAYLDSLLHLGVDYPMKVMGS